MLSLCHCSPSRLQCYDGSLVAFPPSSFRIERGQGRKVALAAAENGFMGMGIGAAMTGLRPIIEGMNMGFLLLAYNQISNNAGMLHYTSGGQYKVQAPPAGTARRCPPPCPTGCSPAGRPARWTACVASRPPRACPACTARLCSTACFCLEVKLGGSRQPSGSHPATHTPVHASPAQPLALAVMAWLHTEQSEVTASHSMTCSSW